MAKVNIETRILSPEDTTYHHVPPSLGRLNDLMDSDDVRKKCLRKRIHEIGSKISDDADFLYLPKADGSEWYAGLVLPSPNGNLVVLFPHGNRKKPERPIGVYSDRPMPEREVEGYIGRLIFEAEKLR